MGSAAEAEQNGVVDDMGGSTIGRLRTGVMAVVMMVVLSGCTLWGWGANAQGQLGLGQSRTETSPVPVNLTASSVSAGAHTCAIDPAQALWCWGDNRFGQLGLGTLLSQAMPARVGTDTWKQVSAGRGSSGDNSMTCGIQSDDSLWCWGDNSLGLVSGGSGSTILQPTRFGSDRWRRIEVGGRNICGIKADQTLWCWGLATSPTPTQIGTGSWLAVSIAGGGYCGIQTDRLRWCGGFNNQRYGDGTQQSTAWTAPTQVGSQRWQSFRLGAFKACGVDVGGGLWCTGSRPLGDGSEDDSSVLRPVDGQATWQDVAVGDDDACGQRVDGSLWCWGQNFQGQVGDGTIERRLSPVAVPGGPWTSFSFGSRHVCATAANGGLWCWGSDESGRLGSDGPVDRPAPVLVNGGTWQTTAAGPGLACGIAYDTSLWCWGVFQPVGDNTDLDRYQPTPIGTAGWIDIDVSDSANGHACGVQTDNTLWCWGSDFWGQLGNGAAGATLEPGRVDGATWRSVSLGATHSCAVKLDDTLWCWGTGNNGELGTGSITPSLPVPTQAGTARWKSVSAGPFHTCGIQLDDSLWCWGGNLFGGLLGDPSLPSDVPQPTPIRIGSASWASIELGSEHTCGIQLDQSLWCWGNNYRGEVGTGPFRTLPDNVLLPGDQAREPTRIGTGAWRSVSAGFRTTCAIADGGRLSCWGDNDRGQLGNGSFDLAFEPTAVGGDTDWYQVDVGGTRVVALRNP